MILSNENYIDIIYNITNKLEKESENIIYRFISFDLIINEINKKYKVKCNEYNKEKILKIYLDLCKIKVLHKKESYTLNEQFTFALIEYKDYKIKGDFFVLSNKRYYLNKKKII